MKDYLKKALLRAKDEGKNPTLTELVDLAEDLRNGDIRRARYGAEGIMDDFITLATDVLREAEDCEDECELYGHLVELRSEMERILKEWRQK